MDKQNLNTGLLFVIAVVAVGSVLRLTGSIFLPLVLAALLSFVLLPVVGFLTKRHVPRFVAILFVLALFLTFGFLIGMVLYTSTQALLREFPEYQRRLTALLGQVIVAFDLPPNILAELNLNRTLGNLLLSFSGNFMSFLSGLLLVIIFLLFILLEQPYLRLKLNQAVKAHATRRFVIIMAHVNAQIGRYLGVKLVVSAMTGLIVFLAFQVIGVDFAPIWGILTFLFNFIPSIGSVVITAFAGIFAVVQFYPDLNSIAAAIIAMSLPQIVIGNILDPKLLGDRLNLSPVVLLLSLLLWGWLWGVMGMFLAVPLTVAIKIIFENIPAMQAAGVLMGTGSHRRRRRRSARKRKQF